MQPLFDSHCHLDACAFNTDRDTVLSRAWEAGISDLLLPATTMNSWPVISALSQQHAPLHPAYGLHPMFMAEHQAAHLDALEQYLQHPGKAVAIGECGLDFYIQREDAPQQRHFFHIQLDIAQRCQLPVIVHARRALDEILMALRNRPGLRGVVHSFSGSQQQAWKLMDLGFYLGLGGPVTYPRAQRLRKIVADMPVEFLLLETDSPDQADADWRGHRNEPARLVKISTEVARLRGITQEQLAQATYSNARRLFLSGQQPAQAIDD